MRKYLIKLEAKNGAALEIVANTDNYKPFIIYYYGSQIGENYSTIWTASAYINKIAKIWTKNKIKYNAVYGTASDINKTGSNIAMFNQYYKRGYFCLCEPETAKQEQKQEQKQNQREIIAEMLSMIIELWETDYNSISEMKTAIINDLKNNHGIAETINYLNNTMDTDSAEYRQIKKELLKLIAIS